MCSFQDTGDAEFIEELSSVLGDEVKQIDTIIVVFKYKVINMTMVMSIWVLFSSLYLSARQRWQERPPFVIIKCSIVS